MKFRILPVLPVGRQVGRQVWLLVFIHLSFVICHLSFAETLPDLALKRGIGARAAGMGGAYSALAVDGSAVFYNPANLAELGLAYTYGTPDTDEKNISGTFNLIKLGYLGYGAWGMKNSASDEVNVTAIGFGNRQGWLNWGINYKDLNWNLSGSSNIGWSSDFGFLLRITPQLKVALLAQDLLTTKATIVPFSGRLGFGFNPWKERLVLAGDFEFYQAGPNYTHLGIESTLMKGLVFRIGADRGEPTAGLSLEFPLLSFDYAALFSNSGKTLHRFEAGFKILPQRERPFSIIKPKEYALIDISGSLKGGRTEYSFLGGTRSGVDSILLKIRKASKDSSIDGILLKLGGFEGGLGGMAVVQELRSELQRAREKGKKIVAYVESSAVGDEYYLAAVADKIVAPPGTIIGGFGKSLAIYRTADLYEKIGIEWQVFAKGKYKTAFDPYTKKMTPEQKKMIQSLVTNLYRQLLTDLAQDRKIKLEKLKKMGDGMIYSAAEAKKMGLIDEVGYLKDAKELAAEILGDKEEARLVEPRLVEEEESLFGQTFGIAVIEIDGEIVSGQGGENIIFGGSYVGSDTIVENIKKASDDWLVKAIILRINSPGGSATAAGEIYQALDYARKKGKKIIASLGDIGASGAYYIAAGADKIVADRSTITGSIGVMGMLPVYAELFEKIGVKADVIQEGKHADMFSGLRKLTTAEARALGKILDETYDEFIGKVVEGRKLSTSEVEEAAQGKIYTGSQAREIKLVDQLGGFSDAIDLAKEEAKIIGEPRLIFYREPGFWTQFGVETLEKLGVTLPRE